MGKFKRMSLVLLVVGVLAVAAGCSCSTDAEVATETTRGNTTNDRVTTARTTSERVTTNTNTNGNNTINGTTDNGTTGTGLIDDIGNGLNNGNTETTSNNSGARNGLR